MFVFMIIPLRKWMNHVISLRTQSSKLSVRTSLSIFKLVSLTQQSTAIKGFIKKGNAHWHWNNWKTTYHKIHFRTPITRKSQDTLRTPNLLIHFYYCIDKNITETRNFITKINQKWLKTNQTILQTKVTVEVVIYLSKSYCWQSIFF